MLSPNSPIYSNLSHATGKALLDLQRSTSRALKIQSTEFAISEGNALARSLSMMPSNKLTPTHNLGLM